MHFPGTVPCFSSHFNSTKKTVRRCSLFLSTLVRINLIQNANKKINMQPGAEAVLFELTNLRVHRKCLPRLTLPASAHVGSVFQDCVGVHLLQDRILFYDWLCWNWLFKHHVLLHKSIINQNKLYHLCWWLSNLMPDNIKCAVWLL